jgi:hypothetical protein
MTNKVMIHEIPTLIKTLLCQLLDEEGAWKELAEKMGYINTNSTKYHSLLVSLFVLVRARSTFYTEMPRISLSKKKQRR